MKTGRRLLLGTFAVLLTMPVVLVAFTRFAGTGLNREFPPPDRSTGVELAALRDFTAIDVRGDFTLEVFSAPEFSVEYTPLSPTRGNFRATVVDGTLNIEGYGNRTENTAANVRVGLPELAELDSESLFMLAVRGFDVDTLDIRTVATSFIAIENNSIGTLDLELQFSRIVELNGNTIGTSNVRHFDTVITTTE